MAMLTMHRHVLISPCRVYASHYPPGDELLSLFPHYFDSLLLHLHPQHQHVSVVVLEISTPLSYFAYHCLICKSHLLSTLLSAADNKIEQIPEHAKHAPTPRNSQRDGNPIPIPSCTHSHHCDHRCDVDPNAVRSRSNAVTALFALVIV